MKKYSEQELEIAITDSNSKIMNRKESEEIAKEVVAFFSLLQQINDREKIIEFD